MKICFVTAFPPSRRLLNEYGFHIAQALQGYPLVSLTILADEMDAVVPEQDDFDVVRCWQLNRTFNHGKLLREIYAIQPDVVWFNLLFSTFGNGHNPVAAFSGLTLPLSIRAAGFYTHVTLHHLMDHVNLKDAGINYRRLYRAAGSVATRMLLLANSVSVLLPAYRRTLIGKYGGENVHYHSHGILSGRPEFPDRARRGNPEHRILVFGKWGTYKRLEVMLQAFPQIAERVPNARLIVAGGDHPMAPGYVQAVAAANRDSRIEFRGYIAEEDIPELFRTASVLVMPYTSATGASGVAHLACQYGLPIISADIPDFRGMAEDEQVAIGFYRIGDVHDLTDETCDLLLDANRQEDMAEQNFSAALRMTMPQIVRQYLRSFDLHYRKKAWQPIPRYRRIPAWMAPEAAFFRAAKAGSRWSPWM